MLSNIFTLALPTTAPVLEDNTPVASPDWAALPCAADNPPAISNPLTPLILLKYHHAAILAAEVEVNAEF